MLQHTWLTSLIKERKNIGIIITDFEGKKRYSNQIITKGNLSD